MIENFYTDIISVSRESSLRDDAGSYSTYYSTIIGSQYGKITPVTSDERVENERKGYLLTHKLFTEVSDIRLGDLVKSGTKTYNVKGVIIPFNLTHHIEIDLEEIPEGQELNTNETPIESIIMSE